MARRAVSGFSRSTVPEGALRTWVSVREGERGPDPVDAFKSGPPVGGNKLSTERASSLQTCSGRRAR